LNDRIKEPLVIETKREKPVNKAADVKNTIDE
jgi:hypothetical protein